MDSKIRTAKKGWRSGGDKSKGEEVLSWLEASILVTGCIDEGDAAGFTNNNKKVAGSHYLELRTRYYLPDTFAKLV